MKRCIRGTFLGAAAVLFSLCLSANGFAADFPDISGHWAESELAFAVEQGYISGFEDGTVRPDESITGAQAVTLLCRMLSAAGEAQSGEWYAKAAAGAEQLGLIAPGAELSLPLSRRQAFIMTAEAFQLYGAQEDLTALNSYPDAEKLPAYDKTCIAALINQGCVKGDSGLLHLDSPLTRAEFSALLYRLSSGSEISKSGSVSDWSGGTLWIDCSAGSVKLSKVNAERVIIRSQSLGGIRLSGCHIGELVVAGCGDVTFDPRGVDKLRVGTGSGKVSLSGSCSALELSGAGRQVSLSERVDIAAISGSKNTLAIGGGARCGDLTVLGEGNTVTTNGTANKISVYGSATILDGRGTIREVYLRAPGCEISERAKNLTDETDYGIYGVTASIDHPELLPAGETLKVSAVLENAPEGLGCTAAWYVDGICVKRDKVLLGGELSMEHSYEYERGMALESEIELILSYTTAYGDEQRVSARCVQVLENYPDDYLFARDTERILALVTPTYQGDYTLEWAESHDYEPFEKEIWVNAKGYESESQYLIWINQACQRVNIFKGSKGSWTLIRECIVGCGAGSNTPSGVFETTYSQPGWFTATYDVRPVVRFKGGGYAFHSRLYRPGTDILSDPGIGYPISHGCIRMYDEDIQWIYDTVPSGTTVVSY